MIYFGPIVDLRSVALLIFGANVPASALSRLKAVQLPASVSETDVVQVADELEASAELRDFAARILADMFASKVAALRLLTEGRRPTSPTGQDRKAILGELVQYNVRWNPAKKKAGRPTRPEYRAAAFEVVLGSRPKDVLPSLMVVLGAREQGTIPTVLSRHIAEVGKPPGWDDSATKAALKRLAPQLFADAIPRATNGASRIARHLSEMDRLGLSAAEYGRRVGVPAATVRSWRRRRS